jgi:DNA-binding FadR family transcriptional regulator
VKKHAEIFNAIKARNPELSKAAVSMILDEALELIELKL